MCGSYAVYFCVLILYNICRAVQLGNKICAKWNVFSCGSLMPISFSLFCCIWLQYQTCHSKDQTSITHLARLQWCIQLQLLGRPLWHRAQPTPPSTLLVAPSSLLVNLWYNRCPTTSHRYSDFRGLISNKEILKHRCKGQPQWINDKNVKNQKKKKKCEISTSEFI